MQQKLAQNEKDSKLTFGTHGGSGVGWYARELGLAPKYLSEICKDITGKPASDWIETYAAHELIKLLSDTRLTITTSRISSSCVARVSHRLPGHAHQKA